MGRAEFEGILPPRHSAPRRRPAGLVRTGRWRGCQRFEPLEDRRLLMAAPVAELPFYQPPTQSLLNLGGFLSGPDAAAPADVALRFLSDHAGSLGLAADDLAQPKIVDEYTDADTGVTHLYLRQTYEGLEVVNGVLNVNVSGRGEVINVGSSFVDLPSRSPAAESSLAAAAPLLAPEDALRTVTAALGLVTTDDIGRVAQRNLWNSPIVLSAPELSLDAIPARLVYLATAAGLQKSWEFVVRPPGVSHWYDLLADSRTGRLLQGVDWANHDASYHVVPAPNDSPTTAVLTTLVDPADLGVSPFGWHDANGLPGDEFADTRGNNVFAQEDADANDTGGVRPSGGPTLTFDPPVDFNSEPENSTAAATVNLFYWTNVAHDLHAHYGFTEDAGNFQQTNYSGQGLGGDPVLADSQDGSSTNNANFEAPPDGLAPRMQMFLWDSPAQRSVTLNLAELGVPLTHGISETFGAQSYDVAAPVAKATPATAATPLTNGAEVAGKIALIERGGANFTVKVKHAQDAGAVGAIIVNNIADEGALDMTGTDPSITIPAVFLSKEDGDLIQSLSPGTFTMRLLRTESLPRLDASFDSTIIVHEYGHGVSTRLTGGPANSNSLIAIQSGGMGEGWSDYFALAMTQQPGDQSDTPMSIASYVLGLPRNGGGLRRHPYALDQTVNPLTFKDYNDDLLHEVHNTGELWTSVLWDLHWLLIEKLGYEANLATGYTGVGAGAAGNKLALQLVHDGLKLQPANPSFIEARDAILLADQIRTGGANQLQIWQAFARRGLGIDAETTDSSATAVKLSFAVPSDFPRVSSDTAALAPGESLVIVFDRPMNPASFSLAEDLASFTGPGGDRRAQITGAAWTDGDRRLALTTDGSLPVGAYTLQLGPNLSDATGRLLDQDGDQTGGESPDDTATIQVAVFQSLVVTTAIDKQQTFDPASLSLREAIAIAADHAGPDAITFAVSVTTPIVLARGALEFLDKTAPLSILGPADRLITISGNDQTRLATVATGVTLRMERLALVHGSSLGTGGLSNSGDLTLHEVLVANNTSLDDDTGGVNNHGTLLVVNSTLRDNTGSALVSDGAATLINCTLTGNSTLTSGAGIVVLGGELACTNCTITANQADSADFGFGAGGGMYLADALAQVVLNNTILSDNYRGVPANKDDVDAELGAAFDAAASHHNLLGSGAGGLVGGVNGNRTNVANLGLGALALHGGLTPSFALNPNSPALDAGDNAFALDAGQQPLTVDQRGKPRIADGDSNGVATVDIGAYEHLLIAVLNTHDAGAGSLRQAILDANASPGADTIKVQLAAGVQAVSLTLPLPIISGTTTIEVPAGVVLQTGVGLRLPLVSTAAITLAGGGTLKLDGGLLQTAGLSIETASGTALDVGTGVLIVDYTDGASPAETISQYISSGINLSGLIWDGPGIMSSAARDDASGISAVGTIDNAQIGYDSLVGVRFGFGEPDSESVPFQSVLVKFTYAGDADLSGSVDGDDLVSFLVGYAQQDDRWDAGDFDYGGTVDGDDLTSLLVAYANQGAPLAAAGSPSAAESLAGPPTLRSSANGVVSLPDSTLAPQRLERPDAGSDSSGDHQRRVDAAFADDLPAWITALDAFGGSPSSGKLSPNEAAAGSPEDGLNGQLDGLLTAALDEAL